jgi:transcription antitermination factor NusG
MITTSAESPTVVREAAVAASSACLQEGICWYAVYTWVHHEKRVAQQLTERRMDCFLPLYRSVRRWKDRRKELELALFPGYVFVRMAWRDRLPVLQLPSVVHLVSSRGQPTPLPEKEIDALRHGLAHQIYGEPYPYLKVGRRVRIAHGPMAGTEGILVRKKDRLRVVLSIDLLMRSVAIEVDAADLESVR